MFILYKSTALHIKHVRAVRHDKNVSHQKAILCPYVRHSKFFGSNSEMQSCNEHLRKYESIFGKYNNNLAYLLCIHCFLLSLIFVYFWLSICILWRLWTICHSLIYYTVQNICDVKELSVQSCRVLGKNKNIGHTIHRMIR